MGHFTASIYWVIWGRRGLRGSCSFAGSFCMGVDLAPDALIKVIWERKQKGASSGSPARGSPGPARTGLETNPNEPKEVRGSWPRVTKPVKRPD